jgi:actin-related protein
LSLLICISATRACREIKHTCTYACKNIKQEYEKLHTDPASIAMHVPSTSSTHDKSSEDRASVEVAHERFATPEIFFDPSIAGLDVPPLQQLVDDAIQGCSIDSRRKLYGNICLSVRHPLRPAAWKR